MILFTTKSDGRSAVLLVLFFVGTLQPHLAGALTIEEAVAQAKKTQPLYQASLRKVEATEALYKASLSPYLPSIDASSSDEKHHSPEKGYGVDNYKIAATYTLFDGGKRSANRQIARLNLDVDREEARKNLIEILYGVKLAFYSAVARQDILDQRQKQVQFAEKDHEVAKGRHKLGLVKLSDELQALVRLGQARYNVVQSGGDLKKAVSELNSLMGLPLQTAQKLDGTLEEAIVAPEEERLVAEAEKRPEIIQAQNAMEIAQENKSLTHSAFYPLISVNSYYDKNYSGMYQTSFPEETTVGVSATWNLFDWSKYYKVASARHEISVAELRLQETKRKIMLDLAKARDDFFTSTDKLQFAGQQLGYAEHNYMQALGEYQAGKGDILSLVQAEGLLADAKGQLTDAKLAVISAKIQWEKIAGLEIAASP